MRFFKYLLEAEDEITETDLKNLEIYADRLFGKIGIDIEFTRHFVDRVNDERNKKQITFSELSRLFREAFKKYGTKIKQLGDDAEAIIKDMLTDLNMPFVLEWNRRTEELDLIAKTIMRKKGFKSNDPEFVIS